MLLRCHVKGATPSIVLALIVFLVCVRDRPETAMTCRNEQKALGEVGDCSCGENVLPTAESFNERFKAYLFVGFSQSAVFLVKGAHKATQVQQLHLADLSKNA